MRSLHSKLSWLKCLNIIGQLCCFEEINSIPAEKKQSVLALKCLGTNVVGTKVYRTAFSGILSSGGLLHSDWLPPNRVIAHYHKVDLISTLLDALTVQNSPRRSRRSSPPAHIENEWPPATLTLSPPAVWTHTVLFWFRFTVGASCAAIGLSSFNLHLGMQHSSLETFINMLLFTKKFQCLIILQKSL